MNLFLCPSPPTPTPCINLGNATPFGVLGASTVTNTGSSVVTGDLGLYPGTSVTGICTGPPGTVIGTCHITDSIALDAQNDLTGAIINYNSLPCNFGPFGVTDLGGLTLTTGVYCYSSSVGLTGTLTLNAAGDPNALFVFKIGSSLTTASSSQVIMINGGAICNIYWVVGSSATLGTGSSFLGNILAVASITLTTGASLSGRALAQTGAVTLDTNAVTICETCNTSAPSPSPSINPALCPRFSDSIHTTSRHAILSSSNPQPPRHHRRLHRVQRPHLRRRPRPRHRRQHRRYPTTTWMKTTIQMTTIPLPKATSIKSGDGSSPGRS